MHLKVTHWSYIIDTVYVLKGSCYARCVYIRKAITYACSMAQKCLDVSVSSAALSGGVGLVFSSCHDAPDLFLLSRKLTDF